MLLIICINRIDTDKGVLPKIIKLHYRQKWRRLSSFRVQKSDVCFFSFCIPDNFLTPIMDLIKLFWYLMHVERTTRNGISISADLVEDTIENYQNETCFNLFESCLDFLTITDKDNIRTLSVQNTFICILIETEQKSQPKSSFSLCFQGCYK